ncbi:MAG: hypothetical protein L6R37_008100 [Teloschistes peruensis]|nr:MAG: hypothetical protein L6R37_008100 [Teloschistes peruensis]
MAQSDLEAGNGPTSVSRNLISSGGDDVKPQEHNKLSSRQIRRLLQHTTRRVSRRIVQPFRKKAEQGSQDQTHAVELTDFFPNNEPLVPDATNDTVRISASLNDNASGSSISSDTNLNDNDPLSDVDAKATLLGRDLGQQQALQVQVQERSEFDASPAGYMRTVEQMTEAEINTEREDRKKIRSKWREDEEYGYLEDPWKVLWEQRPQKGLHQWPCSHDERKAFQLEIIDALNSSPIHEKLVRRGIRAMSCWISLIGLRLNDLYSTQDPWTKTQWQ